MTFAVNVRYRMVKLLRGESRSSPTYDFYNMREHGTYCGQPYDDHCKVGGRRLQTLEDVTVNEGTIVDVQVPSYADRLKGKSRPVGDFAFFGLWKDRADIGNSV